MKKAFIWIVILGIIGGGVYWYVARSGKVVARFETTPVSRGTLKLDVSASGTIQPINIISVGTQISGIIEKVYVDYNSVVKKGEMLAELDKFTLIEDLNEAKAQEQKAKISRDYARLNAQRNKKLFKENFIARVEMEQADVDAVSAQSEYDKARAQVKKAERNLGYAQITSPVSGTVISKEVEEGQTVAASFQTPTLFTIAEDLTKMQIETNVSEADVGLIKNGLDVNFTVDTYPTEVFHGKVSQVRLNPAEEENVVMYTVIIDINNDDLKLLPGMTAYAEIKVQEKLDVLRLQNMAFQFRPTGDERSGTGASRAKLSARRADLKPDEALVYVAENGQAVARKVKKGLSNEMYTEILDGLSEGDEIILEDLTPNPQGSKRRGPP